MKKRRMRKKFDEAVQYYKKYCAHDGYVPVNFMAPDGYNLGTWIVNIRRGRIKLTSAQKEILNEIGFIWNVREYKRKEREKSMTHIEEGTRKRLEYGPKRKYRKFEEWLEIFKIWNIDGYVPLNFVTPEGDNLGRWVMTIRAGVRKVTPEQEAKLNELGFVWRVKKGIRTKSYARDFQGISIENRRRLAEKTDFTD